MCHGVSNSDVSRFDDFCGDPTMTAHRVVSAFAQVLFQLPRLENATLQPLNCGSIFQNGFLSQADAMDEFLLNEGAAGFLQEFEIQAADLRIATVENSSGAQLFDFGVNTLGGVEAGLQLARLCMAGMGEVALSMGQLDGHPWPVIHVATDAPVQACLMSQYAGWQIATDNFFGMGSGPMRAATDHEELMREFDYLENPSVVVGVIESGKIPDDDVINHIAEACNVETSQVALCVAPTSSQAGNVQIVARSIETAMHKLHEVGFDVQRVKSGFGVAPLPPVAADDLTGIGRTNDAILYGASVHLWITGDDESIAEIGRQVPASSSAVYGKPFIEIFEDANRDFYAIDPLLFSPAEITFQNLESGQVHRFGHTVHQTLRHSFGF